MPHHHLCEWANYSHVAKQTQLILIHYRNGDEKKNEMKENGCSRCKMDLAAPRLVYFVIFYSSLILLWFFDVWLNDCECTVRCCYYCCPVCMMCESEHIYLCVVLSCCSTKVPFILLYIFLRILYGNWKIYSLLCSSSHSNNKSQICCPPPRTLFIHLLNIPLSRNSNSKIRKETTGVVNIIMLIFG